MGKKKYKSLTGIQYTFPVQVKRKEGTIIRWISFNGSDDSYWCSEEDIQQAIEKSKPFKDGKIGLAFAEEGTTTEKAPKGTPVKDAELFPAVTDIQDAIEVLVEKYGADRKSLKTPSAVAKCAKENGAAFPNVPELATDV